MKRQWQPLVAAPLTHVDSRSSAGKLTAVGDVREELERDLSSSKWKWGALLRTSALLMPQLPPLSSFLLSCSGSRAPG
jgi:hypothetical protein